MVNIKFFYTHYSVGIFFLLVSILFSCNKNGSEDKLKELIETKYSYDVDGNIKAKITTKGGKIQGEVVTYYPSGQISTLANYINNKKEGIEKKYYKSGQVYRIRPFKNGKLNGTEIRYYKDGGTKTIQEFKHNNPATGLKEFSPGGKIISDFPRILFRITKERDYAEQVLLNFYMSDNNKNVDYYSGKLIGNKYFDKNAEPELSKNGIGEIWLSPDYTGTFFISAKSVRESRGLYITQAKVILRDGLVSGIIY